MSDEKLVRAAFDSVVEGDLDAFAACLHDDVVVELPYAGEDAPSDKPGLLGILRFLFGSFPGRSFELDRVYPLADIDGLIIEYRSDFRSAIEGIGYANRYVGIFEFRDGLISRWVEYANPIPFNEVVAALAAARKR